MPDVNDILGIGTSGRKKPGVKKVYPSQKKPKKPSGMDKIYI